MSDGFTNISGRTPGQQLPRAGDQRPLVRLRTQGGRQGLLEFVAKRVLVEDRDPILAQPQIRSLPGALQEVRGIVDRAAVFKKRYDYDHLASLIG